ncbi:hypothetical protein J6590_014610 [Homalodisca vitripennis]|nr:hypothetical protein J6590_014610 [Homalodisca vitripennis]
MNIQLTLLSGDLCASNDVLTEIHQQSEVADTRTRIDDYDRVKFPTRFILSDASRLVRLRMRTTPTVDPQ